MNRRRLSILLTILISLLMLLLLARCQPDAPEPTPEPTREPSREPTVEPEPLPDPETFEAETLPPGPQLPEVEIEPEQAIITDQIVVTGGAGDIERIIPEPGELGLELVTSTAFDYLAEYPPPGDNRQQTSGKRLRLSEPLAARQQQMAGLRVDLYRVQPGAPSLAEIFEEIAARVGDQIDDLDMGVLVEPDYVTGFDISGDPWSIEGSPWSIEGSGDGSASPAADLFWAQTALGPASAGANLLSGGTALQGITNYGEGVEVAVFDTSPFRAEGGYIFSGWDSSGVDPLTLTVSHPLVLPTSLPANPEEANISDHGLFVSGLVYAMAPASDIHLIQVLNDEGQGTLQGFVTAFDLYLRQRLASEGSLRNTVINLSLGTSEPEDTELSQEAQAAIARMSGLWKGPPLSEDGVPVFSLEIPMLIADIYGATVVAAAGNDSAEEPLASPLASQIPAAYETVVGVAASNHAGARSCYSNDGDLMAPGGDGGPKTAAGDYDDCIPVHNTMCTADQADCEYGVISYVMAESKGFAYWVGTSFATPLVSGLAADIVQAQGGPPPDIVRDTLFCSAQTTGVVDAVAALSSCP